MPVRNPYSGRNHVMHPVFAAVLLDIWEQNKQRRSSFQLLQ
jgi:hypothetical protein